ncbi:MAG: nucleoside hydrolase [Bacteroidetes bacterium]|nr:nucleoside hydrolase [Bacteroidota bacterium]
MRLLVVALMLIFLQVSCETGTVNEESVRIIYDTDMGNDTDDILGLIMLHSYVDKGMVDLMAVCSSKEHPYSVRYIDLLNTWYQHPEIPIGVVEDGPELDSIMAIPRYTTSVVDMEKEGKPLFERSISDYNSLPRAADLYRKLLSESPDHSVVIVAVGMYTNLAALLRTGPDHYSGLTGKELVALKVDFLCIMGGNFERPLPECNVVTDSAASAEIFESWPTRLVVSPFEVGGKIPYPASSFASDFDFVEHHPLIEAKKWYSEEMRNSPTWDMTAVLYAVEGGEGYFSLSEPGKVSIGWEPDIQHHIVTKFTPEPAGKHFYLKLDSSGMASVLERYLELVPMDPNRE